MSPVSCSDTQNRMERLHTLTFGPIRKNRPETPQRTTGELMNSSHVEIENGKESRSPRRVLPIRRSRGGRFLVRQDLAFPPSANIVSVPTCAEGIFWFFV